MILVVPMCLLCSVVGVALASMDINIFVQIGFVVLVGLAAKNAILIVEFAKEKSAKGATPVDATVEACRLRLRPIIMTSAAFILGVVPLAIAVGAGAEMRRALGIAVFSGMLGVTLFGIFLTPVFYYAVVRLFGKKPVAPVAPSDGRPRTVVPAQTFALGCHRPCRSYSQLTFPRSLCEASIRPANHRADVDLAKLTLPITHASSFRMIKQLLLALLLSSATVLDPRRRNFVCRAADGRRLE